MSHTCELCGTQLDPRARVCSVCGNNLSEVKSLEAPDAANASAAMPGNTVPNGLPVLPSPLQTMTPRWRRRGMAGLLYGGVTAVALVGVVGWTAFALWQRGPGGEIAFAHHNRAGNAAFEQGDFTTADAEYSAMVEGRPRRVDGYLLRAINDYRAGRYPQAIRDNTAALALSPVLISRATLYYNRAEAYSQRRDWTSAVPDYTASEQAYRQASAEQEGYAGEQERLPRLMAEVRRGRARANLQLKNYPQTVADYSANIQAGRILPEDYGMRAAAQEEMGQEAEAIAGYGKSICIDAGYMYGYQKLALLAVRSHRSKEAVNAYRQATLVHPDNVFGWGLLGSFEHMAGHYPAAIAADERALSIDPNQVWIQYNLGLSYAVAGDSAKAHQVYATALAGRDQTSRAEARQEVQKELGQHPGSPALQAALRQMDAAMGTDKRISAALPARAASPPSPQVDPAFERLLAATATQHGYTLRPPAGYTVKQTQGVTLSGTQSVDLWSGPARPDGTAPALQVNVIADDGRLAAQASPRQRMQQYLDEMAVNHTQLKVSEITSCTLGLRTFQKASWSGIGAKTGKPFKGVAYISSQTGEYIAIVAHDCASYSPTTLPLLEASARTFHR